MNIIDTIINSQNLATLPSTATKVLKLLENDDSNIEEISNIVSSDPVLSLKVFKVSNSPLFAQNNEVSSIKHAIQLIGLKRLANVVLGVSIYSKFMVASNSVIEELIKKFWLYSTSTGVVATSLTKKFGNNFGDNEFVGGILHQIGKLAMMQHDIIKFEKVLFKIVEENIRDFEAEKQVFGVNHMEVGEAIAKAWNLPEALTDIMASYSQPEYSKRNKELLATIDIAGVLCESNGADFFKGVQESDISSLKSWDILSSKKPFITEKGLDFLKESLNDDMVKSSMFLKSIS